MNKKSNKLRYLSFIFVQLFFVNSFAQWDFSLSTSAEYSDNPFRSPYPKATGINTFNLGIEQNSDALSFGYYGTYSKFSEINERNYFWHQLGFWNNTNNILWGVYAEQRINSLDYNFYNYESYNAYINYNNDFNSFYFSLNTAFSLTNYSELSDLNNFLGLINLQINRSFDTKTTLIGGINFNYKNYFNTDLSVDDIQFHGRSSTYQKETAYVSQLNLYARLGQSITSSTGLSLYYANRNIVGGTAQIIRALDFVYGDESQYFDDPISYEGYTVSAQLTQLLPFEITFKGSYFYNLKSYPSQGIYTNFEVFDESIVRDDKQQILNFNLQKSFSLNEEETLSLNLSMGYQIIKNISNSFWYDYSANQGFINLDFQF